MLNSNDSFFRGGGLRSRDLRDPRAGGGGVIPLGDLRSDSCHARPMSKGLWNKQTRHNFLRKSARKLVQKAFKSWNPFYGDDFEPDSDDPYQESYGTSKLAITFFIRRLGMWFKRHSKGGIRPMGTILNQIMTIHINRVLEQANSP